MKDLSVNQWKKEEVVEAIPASEKSLKNILAEKPVPKNYRRRASKQLLQTNDQFDREAALFIIAQHSDDMACLRREILQNADECRKLREKDSKNCLISVLENNQYMERLINQMEKIKVKNSLLRETFLKQDYINFFVRNLLIVQPGRVIDKFSAIHIDSQWRILKEEYRSLRGRYLESCTSEVNDLKISSEDGKKAGDNTVSVLEDEEEDRLIDKLRSEAYKYYSLLKKPDNDYGASFSTLSTMLRKRDNNEEVTEIFLQVIYKFLSSRNIDCPNCNMHINTVVTRYPQESENRSTTWEPVPSTKEGEEKRLPRGGLSRMENVVDLRTEKPNTEDEVLQELYFKMLCLLLNSRNFHCPKCGAYISKLLIQWAHNLASISKEEQEYFFRDNSSAFDLEATLSVLAQHSDDMERLQREMQQNAYEDRELRQRESGLRNIPSTSLVKVDDIISESENRRNMERLQREMQQNEYEYEGWELLPKRDLKNNPSTSSVNVDDTISVSENRRNMVRLIQETKKIREKTSLLLETFWKEGSLQSLVHMDTSLTFGRNHQYSYNYSSANRLAHSWRMLKEEYGLLEKRYFWSRRFISDVEEDENEVDDEAVPVPVFEDEEDHLIEGLEKEAYYLVSLIERRLTSATKAEDYGSLEVAEAQTCSDDAMDDETRTLDSEFRAEITLSTLSTTLREDDNNEEVTKIFLQVLYKFLNSRYFCCPNCNVHIDTVVTRHLENRSTKEEEEKPPYRGRHTTEENIEDVMTAKPHPENGVKQHSYFEMLRLLLVSRSFRCPECDACISKLLIQWAQSLASTVRVEQVSIESDQLEESSKKHHRNSRVAISDPLCITIPSDGVTKTHYSSSIAKTSEVSGCILSGSLFASITSLMIVTSAAAANVSNGNVVTLALTNLITGCFIIRHNLARILKKQSRPIGGEVEQVDHQNKHILRDGLFYCSMNLASFLFFGIMPPLVYAFSFRQSNENGVKLVTSLGASLICMTLLAILKARLQKLQTWLAYGKNIVYYVSLGVVAFGLSYLAGDLFGKLVEKLRMVQ